MDEVNAVPGIDKGLLWRLQQHTARMKVKVDSTFSNNEFITTPRKAPLREMNIANMKTFQPTEPNRELFPEIVEQRTYAYIHAVTKGLCADEENAALGLNATCKKAATEEPLFANEVTRICQLLQSTEQMLLPFGQVCVEQYSYLKVCGAPHKEKLWSAVSVLESTIGWVEHHILKLHHALPAGIAFTAPRADLQQGVGYSLSCLANVTMLVNGLVESVAAIWCLDRQFNAGELFHLSGTDGETELVNNMLQNAGYDVPTGQSPKTTGGANTAWSHFHMSYFKELPHIPLISSGIRIVRLQLNTVNLNSHFALLTRDTFCGHFYCYLGSEPTTYELLLKEEIGPLLALLAESKRVFAVAEQKASSMSQSESSPTPVTNTRGADHGSVASFTSGTTTVQQDGDSDAEDLLRQIGTDIDDLRLNSFEHSVYGFPNTFSDTSHPKMTKTMSQEESAWAKYRMPLVAMETAILDLRAKCMVSETLELCVASPLVPFMTFRNGYRLIIGSAAPKVSERCSDTDTVWRSQCSSFLNDYLTVQLPLRADGPLKLDILNSLNFAPYIKRILDSTYIENKFEFYNYHIDYSTSSGSHRVNSIDNDAQEIQQSITHSSHSHDWVHFEGQRIKFLSNELVNILHEGMSVGDGPRPSQYLLAQIAQASSVLLHTSDAHEMRCQMVETQEDGKQREPQFYATLAKSVTEVFSRVSPSDLFKADALCVHLQLMGIMLLPKCSNIAESTESKSELNLAVTVPQICDIYRWNWYQDNEPPLGSHDKTFSLCGKTFVEGSFASKNIARSVLDSSYHSQDSDTNDILTANVEGDAMHATTASLLSSNAKFGLDHFTLCLSRQVATTLLPLHPDLSLVCFEIYASMCADVHELRYQPHDLHVDLALLAAQCDQSARMRWHCRYLLAHPTVMYLEDYSLMESVINLLVTSLCDIGEWEEAIKILNKSVERVVTNVQPSKDESWETSNQSGLEFNDSSTRSYSSSFNAFHNKGIKPIIGDTYIRKQRMQGYCDNLHLRLASIFVDFGMLDRAVDEVYTLLSTLCMRPSDEQELAGHVKMSALCLLAKAYIGLDDFEGGKKVCACIKNVSHEAHAANTSTKSDVNEAAYIEAIHNATSKSSKCAQIIVPWGIEDLSCNFSSFGSKPNYSLGIIPLYCTHELHIDLGLLRGYLHFGAAEHMLALKSIAPAMLAVELEAVSQNYPQACLIQLADLYFLRAKIQFEASKNTSHVQYPMVVTVGRVLDIVVKLHVKGLSAKNESSGVDPVHEDDSTASSITMDSSLHRKYNSAEDTESEYAQNEETHDSGIRARTHGAPHIVFNRCRTIQQFNAPIDLLRDSMMWFEWAMDLYKACNQISDAATCASMLAECQLEAIFVPCTFFDTPWNSASDLSSSGLNAKSEYVDPQLEMTRLNPVYNQSMYGTTKCTSCLWGGLKSNSDGRSAHSSQYQVSLKLIESMTDYAMGVFAETHEPLSVVNCYLHRAELNLLCGDNFAATKSFSDARDLFIHVFVDGTSVPLTRRATPPFLAKLAKVVDRLLRFLWTCNPQFINDNLVLFDIHLSFTAEHELALQRYSMAAHDALPKLLVAIAALDKCTAELTKKRTMKNMSNPAPGAGIVGARGMKPSTEENSGSGSGSFGGLSSSFGPSLGFGPSVLMGAQGLQPTDGRMTPGVGYPTSVGSNGSANQSLSQQSHGGGQSQRSDSTSHSVVFLPPGLELPFSGSHNHMDSNHSGSSHGSGSSYGTGSASGSNYTGEYSGSGRFHTMSSTTTSFRQSSHGSGSNPGALLNYETMAPNNEPNYFGGGKSSDEPRSNFNVLPPPPGMHGSSVNSVNSGGSSAPRNPAPETVFESGLTQPLSMVQAGVFPPLHASEICLRGFVKVPTVTARDVIRDPAASKNTTWLAKCDELILKESITSQGLLSVKSEATLVQNVWRCQCIVQRMNRNPSQINVRSPEKSTRNTIKHTVRVMSMLMHNLRTLHQLAAPEEFSYVALMRSLHDRAYAPNLGPESLAAQVAVDSKVRFRRLVIALQVGGMLLMYHPHTGQKHVQLYGCANFHSYAHSKEFMANFLSLPHQQQQQRQRMQTEQGIADRRTLAGLPLFNESNHSFLAAAQGSNNAMPFLTLPMTAAVPIPYVAHMRQLSVESDEILGTHAGNETRVQFMQSLRVGIMAKATSFLRLTCDPNVYLPKPVLNAGLGNGPNAQALGERGSEAGVGDTGQSYYMKQMERQRMQQQQQQFQPMASGYMRGKGRASAKQGRSGLSGITTMITRVISRFLDPDSQEGVPTLNAPITMLCSRGLQFIPWEVLVDEGECLLRASSLAALVGQLKGPDDITGPSVGTSATFVGSALGLPGVPVTLKGDILAHDLVRRQIAVEHALPRMFTTERQNRAGFYSKTVIPPAIDIQNTRVPREIIHKYTQVVKSSCRQEWPCYLPLLPLGKTSILLRSKSLRQVSFVDLSVLALDGTTPQDLATLVISAETEILQNVILAEAKARERVEQTVGAVSTSKDSPKWGESQRGPLPPSAPSAGMQRGEAMPPGSKSSFPSSNLSVSAGTFNPSAATYVPQNMRSTETVKSFHPASISYYTKNNGNKYYVMVMTYTDLLEMSTSVMNLLAHRGSNKIVCIFVPHFCVGAVVKEIVRSLEQFNLSSRTEDMPQSMGGKGASNAQATRGQGGYGYPGQAYGGNNSSGEYGYSNPPPRGFAEDNWDQYQNNGQRGGAYPQELVVTDPGPNVIYSYHIIMAAVLRMQDVHATTISVYM